MTSADFTEQRSAEQTQYVIDSVRKRFDVTQEYLREGQALEFYLDATQKETKENFLGLLEELRKSGDSAILRNTDHGLLLMVFRKTLQKKKKGLNKPLILLLATIITILADGFLRAYGYVDPVNHSALSLTQDLNIGLIYTVALLGIVGIHEMGHKIASWYHKMDSSWPYFIPGIPSVWPTMGAFISARDPPSNRDSLFDLGLSGPIAGLIITLVVSVFAVASAQIIPLAGLRSAQVTGLDYYTTFLSSFLIRGNSGQNYAIGGPMFSILYFGYSIGFLLTFVNLLPAWQLDGGHIANAYVSPRVHKYLTWISAVIMVLAGFWLMAFLVLFLSGRAPSLRPLDDVSPLSSKRKIFFWLTWILSAGIYIFAIYGNAYFGITQVL